MATVRLQESKVKKIKSSCFISLNILNFESSIKSIFFSKMLLKQRKFFIIYFIIVV